MAKFLAASIPDTEVRMIQSQFVSHEFMISVALPPAYSEHLERTYPVIYLLDANWYFGMVTETARIMGFRVPFCNELPDVIVVGIGYPVNGSLTRLNDDALRLRMRDFLPVADKAAEQWIMEMFPTITHLDSGNASAFLQFIHEELIPLIETEYRATATDRTLIGHSWGGTFGLYALFHQPELFQKYVLVSAGLEYANGVILNYARQFAEGQHNLPVTLFLAWGEREIDEDWSKTCLQPLMNILESQHYTGFRVIQQTIPNCKHCGVTAPGFQAGLAAVFSQPDP